MITYVLKPFNFFFCWASKRQIFTIEPDNFNGFIGIFINNWASK